MDFTQYTAVDFLADESFQNYCTETVESDCQFWNNFAIENPDKKGEIAIAKQMFAQLNGSKQPVKVELKNFKDQFNSKYNTPEISETYVSTSGKLKLYKYSFAILFCMAAGFFAYSFLVKKAALDNEVLNVSVYKTNIAERKKVILEDGTTILLNADSKISLRKGYNKNSRELDLLGEAYFEVHHNPKVPFIVHTKKLNVMVLGTVFNVKAYDDENKVEASLISGSIKASVNKEPNKAFVLKPNEKITVDNSESNEKGQKDSETKEKVSIGKVALSNQKVVVETAWVSNGIEIDDETFREFEHKLEREYGVSIEFVDPAVMNYRFTATTKNENITEVLKALQSVNYFKFTMKDKTIEISK